MNSETETPIVRNFTTPDEISPTLFCPICSEVFTEPTRLDCGHTFCNDCINQWYKKSELCPNCRQKIIASLVSRDLLAYTIINDLEVSCNNESKGCPWKGPLSDLKAHMKVCDENIELLQTKKTSEPIIKTPNIKSVFKRRGIVTTMKDKDKENEGPLIDLLMKINKQTYSNIVLTDEEKKEYRQKYLTCRKNREKECNNIFNLSDKK